MPPTRARRSMRMTFWSREWYRLAANRAFSPAMPAPTMQTSQVSTRVDAVIAAPFRRMRQSCIRGLLPQRVADYSTCARHLWDRLGPRDMSLEAQRLRHVAVAIAVVPITGLIAVSLRQQSRQSQEPDVANYQTLI